MAGLDKQDPRFLTNDQQNLLRAALASNKPQQRSSDPAPVSMSAFDDQLAAASAADGVDAFTDFDPNDPLMNGFYEGDTSFDLDNTELSGVFPGDLEVKESHDKRKASESSPDSEEGDAKRREGEDKQAKKPGRKPLTTEPTTKRKAQNRAAQRAFRERKEAHLKDLETKVEQLTKSSEAEKQENGVLRAQVERLQSELKEYRNRMSTDSNRSPSSGYKPATRSDFTFQFPAFGTLPSAGPQLFGAKGLNYIKRESGDPVADLSSVNNTLTRQDSEISPGHQGPASLSPTANPTDPLSASASMQSFAGLFSPTILNGAAAAMNSPDYGFPRTSNSPIMRGNSVASGGGRAFRFNSESASSNNDSPSQSSMSQFNATSSCNTSPAPSQHPSPPKDGIPTSNPGLTSINELSATNSHPTPASSNSIDWLAAQNGGQFDPVLFGDYRETNDAIVGDGDFNNGFFNDAFPFDFASPLNFMDGSSPKPASSTITRKPLPGATATNTQSQDKPEACKKLLAELEKSQAGGDDDYGLLTGKMGANKNVAMLSANAIWNQLQSNKDFQDGKFDLDGLCSELRSKAKCSESGMAVPAADVASTFKKLSGESKEGEHSLIWDEAFVTQTFDKLGANTQANWGGFGLSNEQLSQGW